MAAEGHVLFLQKRSSRAGAQTSLARATAELKGLRPAVLAGGEGWLTNSLREQDTPVQVTTFPSPRSLSARIFGLRRFAQRSIHVLAEAGIRPRIVVANDHQECPLALALAAELGGLPVLGLLRSGGTTERDFRKYLCDRCGGLAAVGESLRQRVETWTGRQPVLLQEGFPEAAFFPPIQIPPSFPNRVLIIGTADPAKGFPDFIEALDRIEQHHPGFPAMACDFTYHQPSGAEDLLRQPRRTKLKFLGRVDGLSSMVRNYSLVIHPSRAEAFGMAPVEVMLAGVPTLASTTGVIGSLGLPAGWQFPPRDPIALAERIVHLWKHWPDHGLDLTVVQDEIRRHYHIRDSVAPLRQELERLAPLSPGRP